jgi:glycosyltransferase involved in cell wall biosynthesis
MRIARIRHLFYPDMPRDYFFELSMRQVRAGHSVDVLTWNKDHHVLIESIANDFTIYRIPGFSFSVNSLITDYPYLPSIEKLIKDLNPEIVHGESHLFLTSLQAIKAAKKLGIPSVVTIHGVSVKRGLCVNLAQSLYLYTFGSWVFKNVNKVICLTRSDAQEIIRYGCSPEKIRVIPNAVDIDLFKLGDRRDQNLVIWTGRFVPEKGLNYLIKAARIVAKYYDSVKFNLIGYGPLREKLMKLAADYGLLNDVVQFSGPFNRNQIADTISKAGISVLPSLKEGLPLSLLEAMSCGAKVVASDIPGVNEVVENGYNGILVPSKNPELLAKSILDILENKNSFENLGLNARETIIDRFSWPVVMKKMEKLYREVIER